MEEEEDDVSEDYTRRLRKGVALLRQLLIAAVANATRTHRIFKIAIALLLGALALQLAGCFSPYWVVHLQTAGDQLNQAGTSNQSLKQNVDRHHNSINVTYYGIWQTCVQYQGQPNCHIFTRSIESLVAMLGCVSLFLLFCLCAWLLLSCVRKPRRLRYVVSVVAALVGGSFGFACIFVFLVDQGSQPYSWAFGLFLLSCVMELSAAAVIMCGLVQATSAGDFIEHMESDEEGPYAISAIIVGALAATQRKEKRPYTVSGGNAAQRQGLSAHDRRPWSTSDFGKDPNKHSNIFANNEGEEAEFNDDNRNNFHCDFLTFGSGAAAAAARHSQGADCPQTKVQGARRKHKKLKKRYPRENEYEDTSEQSSCEEGKKTDNNKRNKARKNSRVVRRLAKSVAESEPISSLALRFNSDEMDGEISLPCRTTLAAAASPKDYFTPSTDPFFRLPDDSPRSFSSKRFPPFMTPPRPPLPPLFQTVPSVVDLQDSYCPLLRPDVSILHSPTGVASSFKRTGSEQQEKDLSDLLSDVCYANTLGTSTKSATLRPVSNPCNAEAPTRHAPHKSESLQDASTFGIPFSKLSAKCLSKVGDFRDRERERRMLPDLPVKQETDSTNFTFLPDSEVFSVMSPEQGCIKKRLDKSKRPDNMRGLRQPKEVDCPMINAAFCKPSLTEQNISRGISYPQPEYLNINGGKGWNFPSKTFVRPRSAPDAPRSFGNVYPPAQLDRQKSDCVGSQIETQDTFDIKNFGHKSQCLGRGAQVDSTPHYQIPHLTANAPYDKDRCQPSGATSDIFSAPVAAQFTRFRPTFAWTEALEKADDILGDDDGDVDSGHLPTGQKAKQFFFSLSKKFFGKRSDPDLFVKNQESAVNVRRNDIMADIPSDLPTLTSRLEGSDTSDEDSRAMHKTPRRRILPDGDFAVLSCPPPLQSSIRAWSHEVVSNAKLHDNFAELKSSQALLRSINSNPATYAFMKGAEANRPSGPYRTPLTATASKTGSDNVNQTLYETPDMQERRAEMSSEMYKTNLILVNSSNAMDEKSKIDYKSDCKAPVKSNMIWRKTEDPGYMLSLVYKEDMEKEKKTDSYKFLQLLRPAFTSGVEEIRNAKCEALFGDKDNNRDTIPESANSRHQCVLTKHDNYKNEQEIGDRRRSQSVSNPIELIEGERIRICHHSDRYAPLNRLRSGSLDHGVTKGPARRNSDGGLLSTPQAGQDYVLFQPETVHQPSCSFTSFKPKPRRAQPLSHENIPSR